MVALLPASTPLPRPPNGFSLISLNVLLPNSIDGWWLYKYYPPGVPDAAMAWPARAALLESLLLRADPDIVCLQECAAVEQRVLVRNTWPAQDIADLVAARYTITTVGRGPGATRNGDHVYVVVMTRSPTSESSHRRPHARPRRGSRSP